MLKISYHFNILLYLIILLHGLAENAHAQNSKTSFKLTALEIMSKLQSNDIPLKNIEKASELPNYDFATSSVENAILAISVSKDLKLEKLKAKRFSDFKCRYIAYCDNVLAIYTSDNPADKLEQYRNKTFNILQKLTSCNASESLNETRCDDGNNVLAIAILYGENKIAAVLGENLIKLADADAAIGPHSSRSAETRLLTANALIALGEFDKARSYYQQCLKVFEKSGLKNQKEYISALTGLGVVELENGKCSEGEKILLDALSLSKKQDGVESLSTAAIMSSLAEFYTKQKNFKVAEPLAIESLVIARNHLGSDKQFQIQLSKYLNNTALYYSDNGQYDMAQTLLEEGLNYRSDKKEDTFKWVMNCNLGVNYARQKKFSEAETYLKRGVDLLKEVAPTHPRLRIALSSLAIVEQNNKNYTKATVLKDEAEKIPRSDCSK